MSYSDLIEVLAHVTVDDSQVKATQKAVDAQVKLWKEQRAELITQMGEIGRGVHLLIRGIRMTAETTGYALDPMQNALLGLVGSTTTLIISTAVALTAGSLGILTGVALGMSAFAYGLELSQTAKIIADFSELRRANGEVLERLNIIESASQYRGFMGGNM